MFTFLILATVTSQASMALDQAVAEYDQAQQRGDRRSLERLLADDYRLVGSSGSVETKKEFIEDLASSDYHMNPFKVLHPISRVWPGGAVMGGVAMLSGQSGGRPFSGCLRFVDVWRVDGHSWKVAYSQAANTTAAECAD